MRRFSKAAPPLLLLAAVGFALAFLAGCRAGFRVEGTVRDATRGGAVYGARVSYAGRSTRLFTQEDFALSFPDRPAGRLRVSAPGYETAELEPRLRGRRARVQVLLQGREVPEWAGILVWVSRRAADLVLDIRLEDGRGQAIAHFPGLAWSAQARIWENLGSPEAPARGRLLYEGTPAVRPNPESRLEKLQASLPLDSIARAGGSLGVLELTLAAGPQRYSWTRGDVPLREAPEGQP